MNQKNIRKIILTGFVIAFYAISINPVMGSEHQKHNHKAYHGGCLNVVDKCEIAHVEVKVSGDAMKCWFVGGGPDTEKAVRIPDKEIILSIKFGRNKEKKLILKAMPIELAEETVGDCSFFEGKAEWLSFLPEFEAFGKANVKGKVRDIIIHYPEGYDSDHGHKHK